MNAGCNTLIPTHFLKAGMTLTVALEKLPKYLPLVNWGQEKVGETFVTTALKDLRFNFGQGAEARVEAWNFWLFHVTPAFFTAFGANGGPEHGCSRGTAAGVGSPKYSAIVFLKQPSRVFRASR